MPAGGTSAPVLTMTIEPVNKVVAVLFNYKRPATYKDIAAAAAMHPGNVSKALSSSRDLGLSQLAGKKGLYVLTKPGQEYARLLTAGKVDDASQVLRQVIQSSQTWAEVVSFLNATRGEARNPMDLVLDVERKNEKQWSSRMRETVRDSYVSALAFAGLVEKEGRNIISRIGGQDVRQIKVEEQGQGHDEIQVRQMVEKPQFFQLKSDDFAFEVRKDAASLEFAEAQFNFWIKQVKKKLETTSQQGSGETG